MITLNNYIQEKLIVNNTIQDKNEIKPADSVLKSRIDYALHYDNRTGKWEWDFSKHLDKMKGYMERGSKPERLIATIKDSRKLMNRWMAAIELEWDSAIEAFGQAIEDRKLFTLEEQHVYILSAYQDDPKPYLEHYLELYNIKY